MTYYETLTTFRAYSTEEIENFKFLLDMKDRWNQEDWTKARAYESILLERKPKPEPKKNLRKAPNSSIIFPNGHSYRACVTR
jgi:hypothetical protein